MLLRSTKVTHEQELWSSVGGQLLFNTNITSGHF
jgi:hypothetical protein